MLPERQGRGIGRLLLRRMADELTRLGFTRLQVGVLSANLPARAFYEAMGAEEVDRRTFEEEGHLLPECVYEWSDLGGLRSSS
ncbi:MAG TPA: GNAT family N-acetyltransferase [Nocardioides sp.]|nr:GNAT family N-acetyltransferase [Nocardioides sp.]